MKTAIRFLHLSLLCGCLIFTQRAYAAPYQESCAVNEAEPLEKPSDNCNVELESIKCYSSDQKECYIATYYYNGKKGGTYEVNVVAVGHSYGTRYWISYTDKSDRHSYQLEGEFDTAGKAISNWVKKVIGDCSFNYK